MPQLSPASGQTAAQVQALIDAAVAGKGVIGTVILDLASDTATVVSSTGGLSEISGATFAWDTAIGQLTIFTGGTPQPVDTDIPGVALNYPNVTARVSSWTGTGLSIKFYVGTTGLPAEPARVWISLLRQN